jgi:L-aspartate oxidase
MSIEIRDIARAPVIIGGGLAGLMTALRSAPLPVVVLAKTPLGTEASSGWAQGGVAAALGSDDDPTLHCSDTLAAGDGLCDPEIARRVTAAAPAAIETLRRCGVCLDADAMGRPCLGLEAAHSRRRIVHAAGDGTGREIMRALTRAVRATPSITVLEGVEARRLLVADGAVAGVLAASRSGAMVLPTGRVVIATGGVGGLYLYTTNPLGSSGQGLALAAHAGATLADLKFVQFHPTALDTGPDASAHPLPLVSEAVRGEGARLIDETGTRFMETEPGRELAPRDVVARTVWRHLARGHRVFLDARQALGAEFAQRFPVIATACAGAGIDPASQPIPIRPAAHYHMGGIAVDGAGRSDVGGLWACGEAACTGLHGANRLASNSLLEAIVCAEWVAESIAATPPGRNRPLFAAALPPPAGPLAVRPVLSGAAGVLRDRDGLVEAVRALLPLACSDGPASDPAIVALMITIAALRREESRGAHFRTDCPHSCTAPGRVTLRLTEALRAAHEIKHSVLDRRAYAHT